MTKATPIGGEQNLMVCVRARPMNEDEVLSGATQIVHKVDDSVVVLLDPLEDPDDILRVNRSRERQFVYDHAFDGNSTQSEVYQQTTRFLIENVIGGYNATVFAYGATGAGKTHTMLGTDEEPGIMYRTMEDLFWAMNQASDEHYYHVTMSYLEIYNEMIRDLLNPLSGYLELREDPKGVQVAGLSEAQASSTEEVMELLKRGNLMRTTEPTAANKTSSRSHAVLQICVRQRSRVSNITEEIHMGKLFLIDLAGSERASNTHNRGKRMVEGAHINRSLLALGNCINALTDTTGKRYINYRDSKLTRLLKDALGGNCKTVMIAHISPASFHFEESRNTLAYADRAKHIKTKVRRNVTDVNYHIAQYTNIISELRQEIFRLRSKLEDARFSGHKTRDAENQQNRSELQALKDSLLSSFQEQMDLRYKIMHLTTKSMDLRLCYLSNRAFIMKWEAEKTLRLGNREAKSTSPNIRDQEKVAELAGMDELPDPEDVANARAELRVCREERSRVEKLKFHLERELQLSRNKAKKMEENLPEMINSEEHKEILTLLCQVHELEIENTELQSESLLKEHEIRKRDLVITQFRNHRQLCDEIISHQRELLRRGQVEHTKELEELMELYQQDQTNEPVFQIARSTSELQLVKDMEASRLYPPDIELQTTDNRNLEEVEAVKVFSKSPKTKHIQEAKRAEERSDQSEIASNTRSIAALAAQRRHRLKRENVAATAAFEAGQMSGPGYLTRSRLEKYNRYQSPWSGHPGSVLSDDNASSMTGDRASVWTDGTGPLRGNARGLAPGTFARLERQRRVRTRHLQPNEGELQLITTNPRKVAELKPIRRQPGQPHTRRKNEGSYAAIHENKIQELETSSQSSSTVHQIATEKGKGMTLQKSIRAPPEISTSAPRRDLKRVMRKPPPNPQHKKTQPGGFFQPMVL